MTSTVKMVSDRNVTRSLQETKGRSAITVFPQRTDGKHDFKVWNPQLLSYAGYKNPDGSILGDPANVEFTEECTKLGWKPSRTQWDILPLVLSANGHDPDYFDLPQELVLQVPLTHPTYDWFEKLQLRWYALPAVSGMLFDCGGLEFTAAPFNGWYMITEIGCRNLCDVQRLNMLEVKEEFGNQIDLCRDRGLSPGLPAQKSDTLPLDHQPVALRMGLDTRTPFTLWKDKALVEVNYAVLHSFQSRNITIVDHHTASETFMKHYENELRLRNGCPADWVWIVPPLSGSVTPVFHQEMAHYQLKPSYDYQEPAWKTHLWNKGRDSNKTKKPRRKFHFKQIARAVKFTSKLFGHALSRRIKATVLYATETGKSEIYAKKLNEIFGHAFNSQVYCLDDYDISSIEHEALILVVTSTFGNGDPPENGEVFAQNLYALKMNDSSGLTNGHDKFSMASSKSFIKANSQTELACQHTERRLDRLESLRGSVSDVMAEDTFGPLSNVSFGKARERSGIFLEGISSLRKSTQLKAFAELSVKVRPVVLCRSSTQPQSTSKRAVELTTTSALANYATEAGFLFLILRFAVFALGSSAYPNFCAFGKYVDNLLGELGGERLLKLAQGDEMCGQEQAFRKWAPEVFRVACETFCLDDDDTFLEAAIALKSPTLSASTVRFMETKAEPMDAALSKCHNKKVSTCNVAGAFNLHGDNASRATMLIHISTELPYLPGDHVGVFASNRPEMVEGILARLQSPGDLNVPVELQIMKETHTSNGVVKTWEPHERLPACSLRTLFTKFLDITTPPDPNLLQHFSSVATDPEEQQRLRLSCLFQEPAAFEDWRHWRFPHLLEVLEEFPSVRPSAALLAAQLSPLQPRFYSISSSPMVHPGQIHITVAVVTYRTQAGQTIGKAWLFFGCRQRSLDLYRKEKQDMLEDKVLDRVFLALSREPTIPKTYVQDLIRKEAATVYQKIVVENGHFYVCGDCTMAEHVLQMLKQIIQEHGRMTDKDVENYMLKFRDENRYHEDIFGITLRTAEVHNRSRESARIKMASHP
uniref:nitric-oxide synthase (NADPH) n=1 Tax=Timema shepardi TaxID=629360 RepID=A0A7R9FZG3_TIMSH|nr:unnamed protein product [Timema shepardi]